MASKAPAKTTTTTNNNNNNNNKAAVGGGGDAAINRAQNPRLKRVVYSKYRELLGSYNDKANAIIEALPAYRVQKERALPGLAPRPLQQPKGDGLLVHDSSSSASTAGGHPLQRPVEAPACVQNAMMTKDKKPFTYTPGGIDLSQIKSERMAKRLARNAQAEGATGVSQLNRPTQQPGSPPGQGQGPAAAAASLGAAAMGVPFQVFPTGPPPPAPTPPPSHLATGKHPTPAAAPPPPPPPASSNTLAPHTNKGAAPGSPNAAGRRSPNSQRFEPPPLGFRPEIKIPPNPMAALKKITPPVEKNSFWVDEYCKERSKSPLVNAENKAQSSAPSSIKTERNHDDANNTSSSPEATAQPPTAAINNSANHSSYNANNSSYQQSSPPVQPAAYSPKQEEKPRAEFRSVAPPQSPAVSVYTLQQPQQQQQQQQLSQPSSPLTPASTADSPCPNSAQAAAAQSVPWRTQRAPQPQQQPVPTAAPQQPHPQPIYNNVAPQEAYSPATERHQQQRPQCTQEPKPTNVGSLYIAPLNPAVEPQAPYIVRQQQPPQQEPQQRQPPTARWMSSQPVAKEQPAWARPDENGNVTPSSLHQMQPQSRPAKSNGYAAAPTHTTGLRLQINTGANNQTGAPKERIIPIQMEETPTPTQTPPQQSFGPQLHYNNNNSKNGSGRAASGYVMRLPNQFVDQGYNNYSDTSSQHQQQPPMRVVLSQQQQTNSNINTHTNNNSTNDVAGPKTRIIPVLVEGESDGTRGPISQTPIIIQNDQRTPPVQSKSFRILQKITDTIDDDGDSAAVAPKSAPAEGCDAVGQLQRPQYARQMSAQQARKSPNIEQMKRMQIAQEQKQFWPQGNTAIKQQQQHNKYPQQHTIGNEDAPPQQYVPPSEQQVPEPRIYTGAAIPSRSFKILQAMTTPENAVETEDSDSNTVELNEKSNQRHNPNPIPNLYQNQYTTNTQTNCKKCSSIPISHPNIYHPCSAYPPFAWCPQILPPGVHGPFPYPVPGPPTNTESIPSWPYPYPMPPFGDSTSNQHYPPYPYYCPYFLPPLRAHHTSSPSSAALEYDYQNAYDPSGFPFANATSCTQYLNTARRAVSVLPDIIVTPSMDELAPVPMLYTETSNSNHDRSRTRLRARSLDINDTCSLHNAASKAMGPITQQKRADSVIDMLEKRLNEIKTSAAEPTLNMGTVGIMKDAANIQNKRDPKSPIGHNVFNNFTPEGDSKPRLGQPLQAIKSVTNVQVYNGRALEENGAENEAEKDEDDVTTADGESDIFDEEDGSEVVGDFGLDECIEEDDEDDDDLLDMEDLSVIYEEESEMEQSSDQRTALKIDISSNSSTETTVNKEFLAEHIDHSDDEASENLETLVDDEGAEDSTSVTVRLPLKFSFSRSSNDENIATVEIGNSQIEGNRSAMNCDEKWNGYRVSAAKVKDDFGEIEDDDIDGDVNVTVNLTPSSRSTPAAPMEPKPEKVNDVPKLVLKPRTTAHDTDADSDENVSVSFSLRTRKNSLNRADLGDSVDLQTKRRNELISEAERVEEIDFFGTLRATKIQAQKIKEQSANYWGKTTNKAAGINEWKDTQSTSGNTEEIKTTESLKPSVEGKLNDDNWWNINDDRSEHSGNIAEGNVSSVNGMSGDNVMLNIWANINEDMTKLEAARKTAKEKDVETTGTDLERSSISKGEHSEKAASKKKAITLETARSNFWSAVEGAIKEPNITDDTLKEESEAILKSPEKSISHHHECSKLSSAGKSSSQTQESEITCDFQGEEQKECNGSCYFPGEPAEKTNEASAPKDDVHRDQSEPEEDELDFWAAIEEAKLSISTEQRSMLNANKYPEEPREVDTDEEIDFWAVIEAEKSPSNDEVTFQKAASFWANRDRQNSVDETPYKPLTQTPFPAKLPDESSVKISSWTTTALEAAKGEDPEIIDPAGEEENKENPAEQFKAAREVIHSATMNEADEATTIGEIEKAAGKDSDKDELEIKRNNYRKAMAFFTTSIDEHKDRSRPMSRNEAVHRATRPSDDTNDYAGHGEENSEEGDQDENEEVELMDKEALSTDGNSTPTNVDEELLPVQESKHDLRTTTQPPSNDLPDQKVSVRDRISAFEAGAVEAPESIQLDAKKQSLSVERQHPKSSLSRNSSCQRSESEMEEDDSGVTDMNKQLSETDTESESFPELRKMTSYQRAATHSRLFKLLQDENDEDMAQKAAEAQQEAAAENESQLKPSRRKIVHNVSVTRRQNPSLLNEAETMSQRRERLSLPLRQKNSIDADNPSTPNSPVSPIQGQPSGQRVVSDKLVNELVQSLLLKRESSYLRNIPMEKLQAAAKLVLEEELDSAQSGWIEATSADVEKLVKTNSSYTDYYNTWSAAAGSADSVASKAFRALQDRPKRSPWSVKCPRVLSSKTINRDLTRVTESPEILVSGSKSPECFAKESCGSKWRKF